MSACPYNVRNFSWLDYSKLNRPDTLKLSENPDISPSLKGVVSKCIFCYPRLDKLKRSILEGTAPKVVLERIPNWREESEEKSVNVEDYIWAKAVDLMMMKLLERTDDQLEIQEHYWDDFEPSDFQFLPACVQTCPARAILFGDLDDSESIVSRSSKDPSAFRLLEEFGTKPNVIYLR